MDTECSCPAGVLGCYEKEQKTTYLKKKKTALSGVLKFDQGDNLIYDTCQITSKQHLRKKLRMLYVTELKLQCIQSSSFKAFNSQLNNNNLITLIVNFQLDLMWLIFEVADINAKPGDKFRSSLMASYF